MSTAAVMRLLPRRRQCCNFFVAPLRRRMRTSHGKQRTYLGYTYSQLEVDDTARCNFRSCIQYLILYANIGKPQLLCCRPSNVYESNGESYIIVCGTKAHEFLSECERIDVCETSYRHDCHTSSLFRESQDVLQIVDVLLCERSG